MPVIKKTKLEARLEKIKVARKLADEGYTVREIGKILGMSSGWVSFVLKGKETYAQE